MSLRNKTVNTYTLPLLHPTTAPELKLRGGGGGGEGDPTTAPELKLRRVGGGTVNNSEIFFFLNENIMFLYLIRNVWLRRL